jgi:diketogulonate reductase-like aldo/keto reductase
MPRVGLGTWQLSASQVGPAVHAALQAGYRHLDCASIYNNEAAVRAWRLERGDCTSPRGRVHRMLATFN